MCNTSFIRKLLILITVLVITSCGDSKQKNGKPDQIDGSLCQFSQGSCTKEINGVKITLLINPKTVPSEKNIQLKLSVNKPVKIKSARIEGRDMFMGMIPIKFNSIKNKEFLGDAILGTCASGYMVWRLIVNIDVNGTPSTVFYDFLADNG